MPLASKAKKTTGALVTIVRRRRSASLSARAGFGWMLKELIYSSGGGLLPGASAQLRQSSAISAET